MKADFSFILKAAIVDVTFSILLERFPRQSNTTSDVIRLINIYLSEDEISNDFFDDPLIDEALFILLIPYITVDNYIGDGEFIGVYEILKSYYYALSSDEIKRIAELLLMALSEDALYKPLDLPLLVANTFGSSEIKISEVYMQTMEKFIKSAAIKINNLLPKSERATEKDIDLFFKKDTASQEATSSLVDMNILLDKSKEYSERLTGTEFNELPALDSDDNEELYFKLYIPPEENIEEFNATLKKNMAFGLLAIGVVTAALVVFLRREKGDSTNTGTE